MQPSLQPPVCLPRRHLVAVEPSPPASFFQRVARVFQSHRPAVGAVMMGASVLPGLAGCATMGTLPVADPTRAAADETVPREAGDFLARVRSLEARKASLSPEQLAAERRALFGEYQALAHTAPMTDAPVRDPAIEPRFRPEHIGFPVRVAGPAFGDGPRFDDVDQGQLADCWITASLAGLAYQSPEVLERAVHVRADGTYDVTLYEKYLDEEANYRFRPHVLHVRPDFYGDDEAGRTFLYADPTPNGQAKIWVALIEKAFAQMRGGYGLLRGGTPNTALEALTGTEARLVTVAEGTDTGAVYDLIRSSIRGGRAVVVSTRPETDPDLVHQHGYMVVDAWTANGRRWVGLYNPHGPDDRGLSRLESGSGDPELTPPRRRRGTRRRARWRWRRTCRG